MGQTWRFDLARLAREHRIEQLEQTLLDIAGRGTPMTEHESRLIAEISARQLTHAEHRLSPGLIARLIARSIARSLTRPLHILARRLAPPIRRYAHRIRGLMQPRIGRLQHYAARPVEVPRAHFKTRVPDPAPRISLVTPSFQHGRFIERTILSVVTQAYPALEYVIQDGGSTDETTKILAQVGHAVSGWVSEPDNGHADALNRGFRNTTGEIMGWLNSDDLLLPGSLAYLARYFSTHPDVDVVYGNRVMIDEHDAQIGVWVLPPHDDRALTLADYVPQETLFWRRGIWNASGARLDETYAYALDWDLLLRFRDAGARIVHVPRYLGAFRVHREQRTSASYQVGLDEMARLRERVHGRPLPPEEVHELLRPYMRRHVWAHLCQRVVDRFPVPRVRFALDAHSHAARSVSPAALDPTLSVGQAVNSGALTPSDKSV